MPEWIGDRAGVTTETALRWTFVLYAALGVVDPVRYRTLSPAIEPTERRTGRRSARRGAIVYRLAALFSLDAFGGGFVLTALVVLWLQRRFDLSIAVSGAIFFWAGVLSAFSALVAVRIAARIGLVRTMVFTHLPANGLLILAAFMPTAPLAVAALLARVGALADGRAGPHVVRDGRRLTARAAGRGERDERAAQPGVGRSRRCSPAGCSGTSDFGWPLVVGGVIKATYDLLLLRQFRDVRPPEELVAVTPLTSQRMRPVRRPLGTVDRPCDWPISPRCCATSRG